MEEKLVNNVEDFLPSDLGVDDTDDGVSEEEMPEAEDAAMPDESDAEMPEAEATKPPPGFVPKKDIDNLRSTYDRQVNEAKRTAQTLDAENRALKAEFTKLEDRLIALETQDMTAEEAERHKRVYEIDRRARELDERERRLATTRAEALKEQYAVRFSTQYGVPKQVLLDAPTNNSEEMETWAKHYQQLRRSLAGKERKAKGTDVLDSGAPARGGLSSFRDVERAYAEGRITDAQYAKARQRAGIGT